MSCSHNMKNLEKSILNHIYCKKCGSILLKTENEREELLLIKPEKYNERTDIDPLIYLLKQKHSSLKILPKTYSNFYLKIREDAIFFLKSLCVSYQTSDKVFFTSISYLDRIMSDVSKMSKYNFDLNVIVCFILAGKFSEIDAYPFSYSNFNSSNNEFTYDSEEIAENEISVLQKLNYNLNDISAFDVLMSFIHCGFIFENEMLDEDELNDIYKYTFSLLAKLIISDVFCKFDSYAIAFSIIHFARKYFSVQKGNLKYLKFLFGIHLSEYKDCFIYIKNYLRENDNDYSFIRPKNKNNYENIYTSQKFRKNIQKLKLNINIDNVYIKQLLTPSVRNIDILDNKNSKIKLTYVPHVTRNFQILS